MSATLEQAILEKIQDLPDEKQQEVLALVDEMLKEDQASRPRETRPIWKHYRNQLPGAARHLGRCTLRWFSEP